VRLSACLLGFALGLSAAPAETGDLLAPWQSVAVAPVSPDPRRHTVHTYFNTSPESPDGRWVVFYASTTREGYTGEVRIRERATGREKVIARGVVVEDVHRAACQQWVSGGKRVVFHDLRNGDWVVVAVDVDTLKERVLARGRMVSWGPPHSHIVPIYGPHWAPGDHPDLSLLNVETGEMRKVVKAAEVRAAYPELVSRQFGDKPVSVYFPILSPDLKRVVFKMSMPAGGDFRSTKASIRNLLIGYDLEQVRFLFGHRDWGHPAWHPDSRTLINVPNVLIDTETGVTRPIPDLPRFPGSHPSISPDGKLFATETLLQPFGGQKGEYGIVVADLQGKNYKILRRFDNSRGAASWRVSHPHPSFSPDGRRLYFNVNATEWTQLYVAESTWDGKLSERR
jgi:Tol biopolymer transport system component